MPKFQGISGVNPETQPRIQQLQPGERLYITHDPQHPSFSTFIDQSLAQQEFEAIA